MRSSAALLFRPHVDGAWVAPETKSKSKKTSSERRPIPQRPVTNYALYPNVVYSVSTLCYRLQLANPRYFRFFPAPGRNPAATLLVVSMVKPTAPTGLMVARQAHDAHALLVSPSDIHNLHPSDCLQLGAGPRPRHLISGAHTASLLKVHPVRSSLSPDIPSTSLVTSPTPAFTDQRHRQSWVASRESVSISRRSSLPARVTTSTSMEKPSTESCLVSRWRIRSRPSAGLP